MINTPLLEATMTGIKDHPETHDQGVFFNDDNDCGTAACFAGHACLLAGCERTSLMPGWLSPNVVKVNGESKGVWTAAQELLGLTGKQAGVLFDMGNTRSMLELMVKDLVNTGDVMGGTDYYHDLVS